VPFSKGLYYKNAKILFLGLDNAGKTTLMHVLRDDKVAQHIPTQQPTAEEVVIGNIKFRAFDLGGHAAARQIWRNYYTKVDAIVYMVDAADRDRFNEAKKELDVRKYHLFISILNTSQALLADEQLTDVPFLILGNKIDVPHAASEEELRTALGVHHLTTGKGTNPVKDVRPIEVFMCSVVRKMGYGEGFRWLSQYL
jgi:GTP-binding protein SAR1